jgi:hypothetical protein
MLTRDFLPQEGQQTAKLSAILMADSFVYCLLDASNNILGHRSYEGIRFHDPTNTQALVNDAWLCKTYQDVLVTTFGGPTYFMQDDLDASIPIFPGLEKAVLLSDQIPTAPPAAIVYGVTVHQRNLLQQLFEGKNMHVASALTRFLPYAAQEINTGILLHVEQKNINILCVRQGNVVLYNTYEVDSPKDILYFGLAAMKECGLTPGVDKVRVSGWVSQESALFQSLSWYMKAELIQPASLYQVQGNMPEGVHSHAYFLHYCASLCAS